MAYVYEMQFLALELPWVETSPALLLPNFSILLYKKKKKKWEKNMKALPGGPWKVGFKIL